MFPAGLVRRFWPLPPRRDAPTITASRLFDQGSSAMEVFRRFRPALRPVPRRGASLDPSTCGAATCARPTPASPMSWRPAVPQPGGPQGRKGRCGHRRCAGGHLPGPSGSGVRPACVARRRTVAAEHARTADQPEHPDSPFEHLTVVDYGDAAVDPLSIENSMQPIRPGPQIAEVVGGPDRARRRPLHPLAGTPPRWLMSMAAATSG